jgi:hypothetical protein
MCLRLCECMYAYNYVCVHTYEAWGEDEAEKDVFERQSCIRVCLCVCVCVCKCVYMFAYVCMHTCIHIYIHTYIRTHTCIIHALLICRTWKVAFLLEPFIPFYHGRTVSALYKRFQQFLKSIKSGWSGPWIVIWSTQARIHTYIHAYVHTCMHAYKHIGYVWLL